MEISKSKNIREGLDINNWEDIKWIFEEDGALRDIYIQEITLLDWEKLLKGVNKKYDLIQAEKEVTIDVGEALAYLKKEIDIFETITINLDGIYINCHCFLENEIELDITPREISSFSDYKKLEKFMIFISSLLDKEVIIFKFIQSANL